MATLTINLTISTPAATQITLSPTSSFVVVGTPTANSISLAAAGPLSPNSLIGTLSVAPASWGGALAVNSSNFTLSGLQLLAGPSGTPIGTYALGVTATP